MAGLELPDFRALDHVCKPSPKGWMVDQSKTNWPLVWLLWAAGIGAAAQYGKISVIFDQLPRVYPDAGASLGFAVSLVGFLGILLGVVAGVLVARIGYRRALIWALCLGSLMSFLQSSFPPLPLFLATRVIEGGAHLAIVVAAPTLISQITLPKHHGFALTLWGTFFGVAFAVLAWAGLPFAAACGLQALMLAHAIYMALMAGALWYFLSVRQIVPTSALNVSDLVAAHICLYRSPSIGAPALGWLFYTISFVAVLTVLPPFISPVWRLFVIGAIPLMSIVFSLTVGVYLLRFFPAVGVIFLGFVLCTVCALGLVAMPGAPIVALALGASLGLVQGASFAAVPELNTRIEDRALANGGLAQMGNLGNTIGTPLMVGTLGHFGYFGMMVALCVTFLGGACIHFLLYKRRMSK